MLIRQFFATLMMLLASLLSGVCQAQSESEKPLRIGIIGLDTSHAPAFAKLINGDKATGALANMKVVAAYPGGSDDIASSYERVPGYTKELEGLGAEIVDSVDALLTKVDAVLLESLDGRKHLEQVLPVFKANKPVFIDKPMAGSLVDALAIDLLAKKYNARWFCSSSLRFSPSIFRFREDPNLASQVRGATAWSPCSLEPTHTDLYWYGVHGVETLYTAMGTGCQTVTRVQTPGTDLAVGVWGDGRVGTFRGIRDGQADYGMIVFGAKKVEVSGKYEGYGPLVNRIGDFFAGGATPVSNEETIELLTFMQAADTSKERGGCPVKLDEVRAEALEKAKAKLAQIDP